MFVGTYYNKLEAKGRFTLPKSFRQDTTNWILTSGLDGCLYIFREQDFAVEAQKLQQLSYYQADHRAVIRHLAGNANAQALDNLGRLLLPENLQQLAQITKELVIIGSLTRIEVWDRDRYHQYLEQTLPQLEEKSENLVFAPSPLSPPSSTSIN